jgi:phage shock protein C
MEPMHCRRCEREVPDGAAFCPFCGAAQHETSSFPPGVRRLTRSRTNGKIAGVCAGFAEYFNVDVTLVRALWLVFSIVPGAIVGGVIAYILAWLVMPEATTAVSYAGTGKRLMRSASDKKIAGVCGGLGEYFGVDSTAIRLLWLVLSILPGALVGGLIAYLAAWIIMPKAPVPVLTPHTAGPVG